MITETAATVLQERYRDALKAICGDGLDDEKTTIGCVDGLAWSWKWAFGCAYAESEAPTYEQATTDACRVLRELLQGDHLGGHCDFGDCAVEGCNRRGRWVASDGSKRCAYHIADAALAELRDDDKRTLTAEHSSDEICAFEDCDQLAEWVAPDATRFCDYHAADAAFCNLRNDEKRALVKEYPYAEDARFLVIDDGAFPCGRCDDGLMIPDSPLRGTVAVRCACDRCGRVMHAMPYEGEVSEDGEPVSSEGRDLQRSAAYVARAAGGSLDGFFRSLRDRGPTDMSAATWQEVLTHVEKLGTRVEELESQTKDLDLGALEARIKNLEERVSLPGAKKTGGATWQEVLAHMLVHIERLGERIQRLEAQTSPFTNKRKP